MEDISDKETITTDNTTKDDNEEQVENLKSKIAKLEHESQQFSVQRARMKDLFMQKEEEEARLRQANKLLEDEMTSLRCQFNIDESAWNQERIKLEQELDSLRAILNDTLEESTKREDDMKVYQQKLLRHESEIAVLKSDLNDQKQIIAPSVMLSNIVKKVSSQLGASDSSSSSQSHESLDESMRKAKEDAEILKSLLLPLEDQIKDLTAKLSASEAKCAKYKLLVEPMNVPEVVENSLPAAFSSHLDSSSTEEADGNKSSTLVQGCDKCKLMEIELSDRQNEIKRLEKQISILERYREELSKETITRKQMEEKWNEKKELHKNQVAELQEKLKYIDSTLINFKEIQIKTRSEIAAKFEALSEERKSTQEAIDRVQKENDDLVGKHLAHSADLQNAAINFPNTVGELQEMCLNLSEDLIKAKVGLERREEEVVSLNDISAQITAKYTQLKLEKDKCKKLLESKNDDYLKVEKKLSLAKTEIEKLKSELVNSYEEKKQLEESELELKKRLASMQTGLEHGEAVQKDFVLLSQSLQKELEVLRVQNHVLRWEYEEDVHDCRGCEKPFSSLSNKTKGNCKHCGRVFCINCLSHLYESPITKRRSPVCNLCHTLLDHNVPPFFSTDPPK